MGRAGLVSHPRVSQHTHNGWVMGPSYAALPWVRAATFYQITGNCDASVRLPIHCRASWRAGRKQTTNANTCNERCSPISNTKFILLLVLQWIIVKFKQTKCPLHQCTMSANVYMYMYTVCTCSKPNPPERQYIKYEKNCHEECCKEQLMLVLAVSWQVFWPLTHEGYLGVWFVTVHTATGTW